MERHWAAEPPNDGSMTTTGEPSPNTLASIRCRPAATIVVRAAIQQTSHQKARGGYLRVSDFAFR
jgi:hypothetical protein